MPIDSVMFWNEPNNKSHWDFEIDPTWARYAELVKLGSRAVTAERPRLLRDLGVTTLRTGLSWADSRRPRADAWFDRLLAALEPFTVTLTFCFTPEDRGIRPHHTSPPAATEEFAEFCARAVRRYAP